MSEFPNRELETYLYRQIKESEERTRMLRNILYKNKLYRVTGSYTDYHKGTEEPHDSLHWLQSEKHTRDLQWLDSIESIVLVEETPTIDVNTGIITRHKI
jgi:hypothetical protein